MIYQFAQFKLDTVDFRLYSHEEIVHCEPMVFDLIAYLVKNNNKLVSRDELLDNLWAGREVSDATLSNHIKLARKAFGDDGQQQNIIQTVRGRGYRLIASPIEEIEMPLASLSAKMQNEKIDDKFPLELTQDINPESETITRSIWSKGWYRNALIFLLLLVIGIIAQQVFLNDKPVAPFKTKITRIAVLPFNNTLNDLSTDYLGFAIADQIIGDLIYFNQISVQPSSAVRQYIGKNVDINEFSEELNLDYVLSGNYISKDNKMKFLVELIQSRTGQLIWRKSFDVDSGNIFQFQENVSKLVSKKLEIQLSPNTIRRLEKNTPKNPVAYELFLKSRAQPLTNVGHQHAIDFLNRALVLDPDYAPIYVELGYRNSQLSIYALGNFEDSQKAVDFLLKSLAMNDEMLEAYAALGTLYTNMGEIEKAVSAIRKAIKINPHYADAHFSLGYVYRYAGMIDESIKSMETALAIEPTNPRFRSVGINYLYNREYNKALHGFNLDKDSTFSMNWHVLVYIRTGEYQKAKEYISKVQQQEPNSFFAKASVVFESIIDKDYETGLKMMADLASYDTPDGEVWYHWSANYAALGEYDKSLQLLERAIDYGFFNYPTMNQDPFYDPMRENDEFKRLMLKAKTKHLDFKANNF